MIEEEKDLKERAGRYKRLSENEDFIKTIADVDEMFGFTQSVFGVLKASHSTEFVLAKEGARAYSDKLKSLADDFEELINQQGEMTDE